MTTKIFARHWKNIELHNFIQAFARRNLPPTEWDDAIGDAWERIWASPAKDDPVKTARKAIQNYRYRVRKIMKKEWPSKGIERFSTLTTLRP